MRSAALTHPTTGQKAIDHLPEALSFSIGGFMGPWHEVKFLKKGLRLRSGVNGVLEVNDTITNPSPKDWDRFWQAVEEAGVWSWGQDYINPDVLDGTQWDLKLRHAGKSVRCEGSNGYPGPAGMQRDPTRSFRKFLTALCRLTGHKAIG